MNGSTLSNFEGPLSTSIAIVQTSKYLQRWWLLVAHTNRATSVTRVQTSELKHREMSSNSIANARYYTTTIYQKCAASSADVMLSVLNNPCIFVSPSAVELTRLKQGRPDIVNNVSVHIRK